MKKESGFSLVELLIVVAVIAILAALAVPSYMRARQSSNEASAISSIRAIDSAQISYRFTDGAGINYANSLAVLNSSQRIDSKLASGSKSGYNFTLVGVDAISGGLPSYFDMIGNPQYRGFFGTGQRSFASNESYLIYQRMGADLVAGPPPPGDRTPANSTALE